MKKYIALLLFVCILLAACGYDDKADISHDLNITNLSDETYAEIGSVQNKEKPAIDTLKKVTITLDVKNYDDLDRPEIIVNDNVRTLFGNDYWYGSYVLDEGHYTYQFIVSIDTLTAAQIKEKLTKMHYTVVWYVDDQKKKTTGHFGE